MQFHEYLSLRNRTLKFSKRADFRSLARHMKTDEMRSHVLERVEEAIKHERDEVAIGELHNLVLEIAAEQKWVDADRPFYNVWPIAESLANDVRLNLPFSAVEIPFNAMVLRFARGHEPCGLANAIVFWDKEWQTRPSVNVVCFQSGTHDRFVVRYDYDPDELVENWLQDTESKWETSDEWRSNADAGQAAHLRVVALTVRLVVFIGLLANDRDMVTPIVLTKDQAKYESTDDDKIKKWLEDRAARRAGRGFDVGKKLQAERDASPHWRNPHLCLFWTGTGRTKPIIQMRRGAVVQRVSMADVPTGYLGPESDEELVCSETTPRESISKARRFSIFKRDEYRCRLCGKSAGTSVTLHVDHRVPLAKGGSNEDDNLWTLCDQCNLGKSDTVL